jgi:hypothetical protein
MHGANNPASENYYKFFLYSCIWNDMQHRDIPGLSYIQSFA